MSTERPLFQLRKELNSSCTSAEKEPAPDYSIPLNEANNDDNISPAVDISIQSHQDQTGYNNTKILTENEKYIVKKLSPDLTILPETQQSQFEGLVDTHCGKALINDNDYLYIWDYQSPQRETDFCKIPLHEEYAVLNTPPKCLFTWPATIDDSTQMFLENSSGTSAGVCIVQRKNSQFIYFEDIDSVNNLNSQLSKSKAHVLNLKLKDGETVFMAINCEPAGIVISTSFGRLLFVTLRDSTGRLKLQLKQQLIKSQKGFLFHSFNSSKEIVSLKVGAIVGRGERLLYAVTKGGDFQTWHLSLSINSFKRIEINVFDQILDSLQGLYPFAHGSLQILDSHPLFSDYSSAHVILSSIANEKETYYILSTIILDEKTNSFTIFSTYRLNTYVLPFNDYKPKLFIPCALDQKTRAVTTVFVSFSNAVVLTQVSSHLDSSFPLRRKWEDIIRLRESIKIIGSGYNSDSLYIITREIGVLEISINHNNSTEEKEEVRFVKSHIDQAIYFSEDSSGPIDFNLPKEIMLESEEIEHDLKLSSNEIFFSQGKYIPPMLNNLAQHLSFRIELYRNLLNFIIVNFNYKISHFCKLDLLEKFEIMNCCLQLSIFLENSQQLTDIWRRVQKGFLGESSMEAIMINNLDQFPQIFTQFLTELTNKDMSSKSLEFKALIVKMLTSCLYDATLEGGENAVRFQEFKLDAQELNKNLPWFVNADILNAINDLFFDYKFSVKEASNEVNEQLLCLVKILYYLFNQANLWFGQQSDLENSSYFQNIKQLYKDNHISWNLALCELSLQESSLQIAEFYHDLEALVCTLETLEKDLSQDLYTRYFTEFGFEFASKTFEHYINEKKLKGLFYQFPDQHEYLVRFFENFDSYGDVAWIEDILDGKYISAAQTLEKVSLTKNFTKESLEKRQLHLSIAKLSTLAVEEPTGISHRVERLKRIQEGLDILETQQDLFNRLNQGNLQLRSRYHSTELAKVFEVFVKHIKVGESLTIHNIVETYSMLDGADGFYCALKLLALNSESLDFESKTTLVATVWRRCVLAEEDWSAVTDICQTALYQVLYRFFDEELYRSNTPLPSLALISNRNFLTTDYLSKTYAESSENIGSIKDALSKELQDIDNLGKDFETRIKSVVGSANEATGNRCAINYDSNTVEF